MNSKIEELLDIVKNKSGSVKYSELDFKTDVFKFLEEYSIESGHNRFSKHCLYLLYKSWSKTPIPSTTFFKQLKRKIKTGSKVVLIDIKKLKYNPNEINAIIEKEIFSDEPKKEKEKKSFRS